MIKRADYESDVDLGGAKVTISIGELVELVASAIGIGKEVAGARALVGPRHRRVAKKRVARTVPVVRAGSNKFPHGTYHAVDRLGIGETLDITDLVASTRCTRKSLRNRIGTYQAKARARMGNGDIVYKPLHSNGRVYIERRG